MDCNDRQETYMKPRGLPRAVVALAMVGALLGADQPETGVVNIKLGETIERDWKAVKEDGYHYGPKQIHKADTKETQIFLPYGDDPSHFHEVKGTLLHVKSNRVGGFINEGETNAVLTMKLKFDAPIRSFRYQGGRVDVDLSDTTVGGVEYSPDGQAWTTMAEIKGKGRHTVQGLGSKFQADGLDTDTLYIRYYTRDPQNPAATGPGRYLRLYNTGDPRWGDISRTFFTNQLQIWVKPK